MSEICVKLLLPAIKLCHQVCLRLAYALLLDCTSGSPDLYFRPLLHEHRPLSRSIPLIMSNCSMLLRLMSLILQRTCVFLDADWFPSRNSIGFRRFMKLCNSLLKCVSRSTRYRAVPGQPADLVFRLSSPLVLTPLAHSSGDMHTGH